MAATDAAECLRPFLCVPHTCLSLVDVTLCAHSITAVAGVTTDVGGQKDTGVGLGCVGENLHKLAAKGALT